MPPSQVGVTADSAVRAALAAIARLLRVGTDRLSEGSSRSKAGLQQLRAPLQVELLSQHKAHAEKPPALRATGQNVHVRVIKTDLSDIERFQSGILLQDKELVPHPAPFLPPEER